MPFMEKTFWKLYDIQYHEATPLLTDTISGVGRYIQSSDCLDAALPIISRHKWRQHPSRDTGTHVVCPDLILGCCRHYVINLSD